MDGTQPEAGAIVAALVDGVSEILLNRPDRLNAFNDDMHRAFAAALSEARDDPRCRAVMISGAGRGFCAGQDLADRDPSKMQGPPDLGATLTAFYNPLIRLIRAIPKPVICAVNGVAAGAGANLALACDIVLAAKSARFIQSFARVGLIPDSGGTFTLTRLAGEARAKALAFTAEPLTAADAERFGLIWKAVDDARLVEEARALARRLAAGATFGIGLTKQAIHAAAGNTLEEQLALEAELQRRAGRSRDYAEGVRAFLEKREAKFTGEPS
jgi:2-(1,2-epoxy-1,2-dihydrophenyl)acetyl-CoA isomerase